MPDNMMSMDNISEELKTLPATQYDIAQIRNSLHEIQTYLQKIISSIEIGKTAQTGVCDSHFQRTEILENKMKDVDKRVRELEDSANIPKEVEDLKKRMSKMEKIIYMGLGALAVLQILIPVLIRNFWK